MTAELWVKVVADRAAQGLPPQITDPRALARIAAIVTRPAERAS